MTAAIKPVPVYTVVTAEKEFAVFRNDVVMKTPAGSEFIVPTLALAEAIAEEGRAQNGKPNPALMPMTQLAATAIDITRKQRDAVVEQVSAYAANELLCHRADHPEELVQRQHSLWQPILDWCAKRFDALLRTGQGIMPIAQSPEALQALRRAIESCDDFRLTGLQQAVEVSGSLVLGLALVEKHLNTEQVFSAAECDSLFQKQKWGADPAIVNRHSSIRHDLEICAEWFKLLTPHSG